MTGGTETLCHLLKVTQLVGEEFRFTYRLAGFRIRALSCTADLEMHRLMVTSRLCRIPTACSRACPFIPLCLSLLICELQVLVLPTHRIVGKLSEIVHAKLQIGVWFLRRFIFCLHLQRIASISTPPSCSPPPGCETSPWSKQKKEFKVMEGGGNRAQSSRCLPFSLW